MIMNGVGRYLRHGSMVQLLAIECGGVSFSDLALGNKQNQSRQRKPSAYCIGYNSIRYLVEIKAKANPEITLNLLPINRQAK